MGLKKARKTEDRFIRKDKIIESFKIEATMQAARKEKNPVFQLKSEREREEAEMKAKEEEEERKNDAIKEQLRLARLQENKSSNLEEMNFEEGFEESGGEEDEGIPKLVPIRRVGVKRE